MIKGTRLGKLIRVGVGWVIAVLMTSCFTTGSKNNEQSQVPASSGERSFEDRVKKWDLTKRSHFEKGDKGSRDNRYFKQSGVKRKDYKGNTKYRGKTNDFNSGKDGYRTKDFSQGDKKNRMQQQGFREGEDESRFNSEKFATEESRYSQQSLRDGNKTSRMDGQSYRVPVDHETKKAMEKSKPPLILNTEAPGYSESEIGSFLNRN